MRASVGGVAVASAISVVCAFGWYALWAESRASGWGVDLRSVRGLGVDLVFTVVFSAAYGWCFSFIASRLQLRGYGAHVAVALLVSALIAVPVVIEVALLVGTRMRAVLVEAGYLLLRGVIFAVVIAFVKRRRTTE